MSIPDSTSLRLFFGSFIVGAVLFFAPSVWRQGYQAPPAQTAAQPQETNVVKAETRLQAHLRAVAPLPDAAEEQRTFDTDQVDRDIAPARPPEAWLADQIFEQRLGTSEKDLVRELLAVEEVRVVSDDHIQKVRRAAQAEAEARARAAKAQLEAPARAARARVDDANARLSAIRSALSGNLGDHGLARAFQGAVRDVQEASRACFEADRACQEAISKLPPERERIGYDSDLRLHQTMKRTAGQTGLVLQSGPRCQLDSSTAAQVAKLSKELRDNGFVSAPDVKEFQAWCDQHHLERMTGAVPTLTQMLQVENEAKRLLLVRELTRIPSADATTQLAVRAIVDLSPAVRRAALAELERRPSQQYSPVLLRGLRYPWPPVADHAAVAFRTLRPREPVGPLVDLLDLPSPSTPILDPRTNQHTVRELVRLNHLRNCLLCHPPSANKEDGFVRGLVPTPGEPLPVAYYEASGSHFVRADISFLRQDFSVNLPDEDAGPWPRQQRYDFVTRLRTLSPGEVPARTESPGDYPQRGAVLYALRGLTGEDGGDSSTAWRKLLGLSAGDPKIDNQRSSLEEFTLSLVDPNHLR